MRALALLAMMAGAADPASELMHFARYQREVPERGGGQTCAVVDAAVYAHALPSLKDLRLLGVRDAGVFEVPYVLTLSEAQPVASETARVENLGRRGDRVVFDLAMPNRLYSEVTLDLEGRDFVGVAAVSGRATAAAEPVAIGEFTVFDLSSQGLARSTTLHLSEASYPVLHVELRLQAANGGALKEPVLVRGAAVPPSREAQTLFTVAATTDAIQQVKTGSGADMRTESLAHFRVPARVPIERVSFALDPGHHGNFSRTVRVTGRAVGDADAEMETVEGRIERVRMVRDGVELDSEVLTVPATLGANLQGDAEVEVAVENGSDAPLPLRSVSLAMRRRSLCFDGLGTEPLELFYGDPAMPAPAYDYARTFSPAVRAQAVTLGPEQGNPRWQKRRDERSFLTRHPGVVYLALLGAVCVLAVVAFRARRVQMH